MGQDTSDADRIDDQNRFAAFVAKSKSGFFLLGPGVTYGVRIAVGKPLICDCFLDLMPEVVEQFMTCMTKAKPVFGFACAPGEREQRNRMTLQQGVNTIESWVGRDTQKYVPGFYCLTPWRNSMVSRSLLWGQWPRSTSKLKAGSTCSAFTSGRKTGRQRLQ